MYLSNTYMYIKCMCIDIYIYIKNVSCMCTVYIMYMMKSLDMS